MPLVQRQPHWRGFDECFCVGGVGGGQALLDQLRAEAEAVVRGGGGEDLEDWGAGAG